MGTAEPALTERGRLATVGQVTRIEVTEYVDPGDPWVWGSAPKLRLLQWRYGHLFDRRIVTGGLVDDLITQAASEGKTIDLRGDAPSFADFWRSIHLTTGMPHPTELRSMYRTTKPACLAVKAAQRQSPELGDRVMRRLQEWVFILGEPFDNLVALVAAVSGVPGLDIDAYVSAFEDPEILVAFQEDWEETRRPNAAARNVDDDHPGNGRVRADGNRFRYGFPTLVFRSGEAEETVAGWQPWEAYEAALEAVSPGISADAAPDPTTDQVIARWGTATDLELLTLCGPRSSDPSNVIRHDWGGGSLFLNEAEARARGLETVS